MYLPYFLVVIHIHQQSCMKISKFSGGIHWINADVVFPLTFNCMAHRFNTHDFESVRTHPLPFQFPKLCYGLFCSSLCAIQVVHLVHFYLSWRDNEIKYEGSSCNFMTVISFILHNNLMILVLFSFPFTYERKGGSEKSLIFSGSQSK